MDASHKYTRHLPERERSHRAGADIGFGRTELDRDRVLVCLPPPDLRPVLAEVGSRGNSLRLSVRKVFCQKDMFASGRCLRQQHLTFHGDPRNEVTNVITPTVSRLLTTVRSFWPELKPFSSTMTDGKQDLRHQTSS
ncbi:aldehyde dehydrogenase [Anopheles sinensis]|uniref:Aldehyde dehydrogenase n=1 Tax=Anopheles sinensis TaxID=74873 RepID=A0A084WTJ0_ANOSI|nr:aldehyde dehydrogenase [Anopheles sinensis]